MSDFEDLLTSLGTYTGNRSTDNQPVFGSFRDYFYENSRHNFSLSVNILNNTDSNGYPVWLNVPGDKSSYGSFGFMSAAGTAAINAGFDISTSTSTRLCYIYAGNWVSNIGVFARGLNGTTMVVPERFDRGHPSTDEDPEDLMTHLGYYAHEFGHLMGAHHPVTSHHHALMHSGHKAGTRLANQPASMNPWFLYKSGWASLSFISSDMTDVDLTYNTSATTQSAFYIRNVPSSSECFLVENRQYSNTYDQSLPGAVAGLSGGLLIWNIDGDGLNLGKTDLVEADNNASEANQTEMAKDMFRPSIYTSGKINDTTTPADLNLRNGNFSRFAINNFNGTGNPITVDFYIYFVAPATNLQITNPGADNQHPILQWTTSVDPDLDHYAIYRGEQESKADPINWFSSPAATTSNTTWTDPIVTINSSFTNRMHYRITAVDDANNESAYSNSSYVNSFPFSKPNNKDTDMTESLPTQIRLHPNYPNPFNPETQIRLELPQAGEVKLTIFNITGVEIRRLHSGTLAAGYHTFSWDGRDARGLQVTSGIYFYRFEAKTAWDREAAFAKIGKMTLLR